MQTTDVPRLVRRRDDKIIAGVCGGIADHFGIDVTLVRVVTVVLTFFGGAGLLLYGIAWAMVPEEGSRHAYTDRWMHRGWQPIAGVVLIFIALTSISDRFWHMHDIGFPLFLIGLGAVLLWFRPPVGGFRSPEPPSAPPAPPSPPLFAPEAAAGAADATVATDVGADPTTPLTRDAVREHRDALRAYRRQQASARREWRDEVRRGRRRRRSLAAPTIGVLAIGAGVTGILLANEVKLDATRVIGGGIVLIGIALIVATRYGRATALIPLGVVLVGAVTAVSVITVPFEGGVGQRTYRPETVADVDATYHLAVGELRLDLGAVRPASGTTTHIEATVGVGHLLIDVPADVEVVVQGHTDIGQVTIAGQGDEDGGWRVDRDAVLHRGREGAGKIEIDAQVGLGQVEVRDAA
jgi:phage shock protein PspC (stress-responsive transcriptional regulator)/predicted membrane protein